MSTKHKYQLKWRIIPFIIFIPIGMLTGDINGFFIFLIAYAIFSLMINHFESVIVSDPDRHLVPYMREEEKQW